MHMLKNMFFISQMCEELTLRMSILDNVIAKLIPMSLWTNEWTFSITPNGVSKSMDAICFFFQYGADTVSDRV